MGNWEVSQQRAEINSRGPGGGATRMPLLTPPLLPSSNIPAASMTTPQRLHLLMSTSRLPVLGGSVQPTEPGLLLQPHHHHPGRKELVLCFHRERQSPHFPDILPVPQLNQHFLPMPHPLSALPSSQLCSCLLLSPWDPSASPPHNQLDHSSNNISKPHLL